MKRRESTFPFACEECSQRFRQKNSLEKHTLQHSIGKATPTLLSLVQKCKICFEEFASVAEFKRHVKRHTAKPVISSFKRHANVVVVVQKSKFKPAASQIDKKGFCTLCQQHFKNLEKHKCARRHSYPCNSCNRQFKTILKLKVHQCIITELPEEEQIQVVSTDEKSNQCTECHRQFVSKKKLKDHECICDESSDYKSKKRKVKKMETCPVCSKDIKNMKRHLLTHSKDETGEYKPRKLKIKEIGKCHICSKEVKCIKSHLLTHVDARPFVCDKCPKRFRLRHGLKRHEVVHSQLKPFKCEKCERCFSTSTILKRHKKTHEKPPDERIRLYSCRICNESYMKHHSLKLHKLREHKGIDGHPCDICDKILVGAKALRFHKANHTGEPVYECTECPEKFKTWAMLRRHRFSHPNLVTLYPCEQCGKEFKAVCDRNKHMKLHNPEKPFSCSTCLKTFKRQDQLKHHQLVHNIGKFVCDECGKFFLGEKSLQKHKIMNHEEASKDIKNYVCETCGRDFKYLTDCKRHKLQHTGERPYSCNHCSKTFTRKSYLTEHLRVHSGEKPYACKDCGKAFTNSKLLLQHSRVHTKLKPLRCSVCDKSFAVRRDLESHERIHSGEKPFSCKLCNMKHRTAFLRKKHEEKCDGTTEKEIKNKNVRKTKRKKLSADNKSDEKENEKNEVSETVNNPNKADATDLVLEITTPKCVLVIQTSESLKLPGAEMGISNVINEKEMKEVADNIVNRGTALSSELLDHSSIDLIKHLNSTQEGKDGSLDGLISLDNHAESAECVPVIQSSESLKLPGAEMGISNVINEKEMKDVADNIVNRGTALSSESMYHSSIDLIEHLNSTQEDKDDNFDGLISLANAAESVDNTSDADFVSDSCESENEDTNDLLDMNTELNFQENSNTAPDQDPQCQGVLKHLHRVIQTSESLKLPGAEMRISDVINKKEEMDEVTDNMCVPVIQTNESLNLPGAEMGISNLKNQEEVNEVADNIVSRGTALSSESLYHSSIDLIKHLNSTEEGKDDSLDGLISVANHAECVNDSLDTDFRHQMSGSCESENTNLSDMTTASHSQQNSNTVLDKDFRCRRVLKDASHLDTQPDSPLHFIAGHLNLGNDMQWEDIAG